MIKVTCIVGSARNDGSCAHLTDAFIKGLNTKAQIKKYCVSDIVIAFCKGCKSCYQTGECVTSDEALTKLLKAGSEEDRLYRQFKEHIDEAACEECESYYKEGFRFGVLLGLDIAEEQ